MKIASGLELARREGCYTVVNCGRIPATIMPHFHQKWDDSKTRNRIKNHVYWFWSSVLLLGCDEHSSGFGPLWGFNRAKYPALYEALVGALDGLRRSGTHGRVFCARLPVWRGYVGWCLHTIERDILSWHSEPYVWHIGQHGWYSGPNDQSTCESLEG